MQIRKRIPFFNAAGDPITFLGAQADVPYAFPPQQGDSIELGAGLPRQRVAVRHALDNGVTELETESLAETADITEQTFIDAGYAPA